MCLKPPLFLQDVKASPTTSFLSPLASGQQDQDRYIYSERETERERQRKKHLKNSAVWIGAMIKIDLSYLCIILPHALYLPFPDPNTHCSDCFRIITTHLYHGSLSPAKPLNSYTGPGKFHKPTPKGRKTLHDAHVYPCPPPPFRPWWPE